MISYAQNAEDVVLARLFRNQTAGQYVDVGAGHPTEDSVTKHFSDAGWHGVNVEPMEREHRLLCEERPDDVNLQVALAEHGGRAPFFEAPLENRGASTMSRHIVERYRDQVFTPVTVDVTTLADVCRRHVTGGIDFLKIDVEGQEEAVIRGADWEQFRPRVLVVEATEPNSTVESHAAWEPVLLEHGYRCALFDGLNRFYAQAGDEAALATLAVPANVLDGYEPWRWVRRIDGAQAHIKKVEASRVVAEQWAEQLDSRIRMLADRARALDPERAEGLER